MIFFNLILKKKLRIFYGFYFHTQKLYILGKMKQKSSRNFSQIFYCPIGTDMRIFHIFRFAALYTSVYWASIYPNIIQHLKLVSIFKKKNIFSSTKKQCGLE